MPTPEQILDGLEAIANQWRWLAMVWHGCFGVLVIGLLSGMRPSTRVVAVLLGLPLLSVAVLAWSAGNPFNGSVFLGIAVAAMTMTFRQPKRRIQRSSGWIMSAGILLLSFGWIYLHFLETGSILSYLYAAPLGLVPCPTLSAVLGVGLMFSSLESRVWSLLMAASGIFYGIFGAVRLEVVLDWGLVAGSLVMLAATLTKASLINRARISRRE